jgi:beta-aspartyl-peptidase (threonine type)
MRRRFILSRWIIFGFIILKKGFAMIILASQNGEAGIRQAMAVLQAGGSVLDALEAGIRPVEDNLADHWVGRSGMPSILGEVELDASIMDGRDLTAGAVGCVKGYPNPISIARKVMEVLPHVLMVGEGAERFAAEMGFPKADLMTAEIRAMWRKDLAAVQADADHIDQDHLIDLVHQFSNPNRTRGTVNFIVRDEQGNIATGVSTSGYYGKYPGRLGDTPVIGAGNYADSRYGAAACTGMGEMSIRASTARSVVFYLKMGYSLEAAGVQAMQDLRDLGGRFISEMNIIAMDRDGNPAAFSSSRERTCIYLTSESAEIQILPRTYVEVPMRWELPDHSL